MTEDALLLRMDAVSKLREAMESGWEMADIPEMEAAPDLRLLEARDCGRCSG
jgi:hypothetical protein